MVGSTPWCELGYSAERCAAILRAGLTETCVARAPDNIPWGFLCLQRTGFIGQPYIKLLCVAEAARGRGVGRALVEWAEAEAFERGWACNLFLLVSGFNTAARSFYDRMGFVEVGRIPDYLVRGSDEIILRKTRGPVLEIGTQSVCAKGRRG
jgi:[ribosomal protein S18]-alanine N-acetyltransferase